MAVSPPLSIFSGERGGWGGSERENLRNQLSQPLFSKKLLTNISSSYNNNNNPIYMKTADIIVVTSVC